jgi:hypothetical protein
MLTPFGIVLLVTGAILTFAVDRRIDGVDVQLVGWILMAGGGLSLIVAMIRAAAISSASQCGLPPTAGRPDHQLPEQQHPWHRCEANPIHDEERRAA